MSTSLVSKLPPADVIISSSFETLRSTFKVEFADFYSRVCERYDTPSYTPPGRTSPKFLFRLHTRKRNRINSPYSVELQFYLLSTGKRFSMQYSCSLLAKGEERKYTKVNFINYGDSESPNLNDNRTILCSVPLIKVLDELLKTDVKLTFFCELTFKTEITKHHDAFQSNRELEKKERELIATHLRSLLQTGAHTDVQFEVNGVSFRAHKGILSARSAVFEAMFNEHTLEQQSSHVLIEDLDPDTFQSLLAYIYTGTIPTGEETFEPLANLLAASGRFALASLKDACEASLGKLLSPETAHSLLVLADLHDAPKLKKAAFNFFKKHVLDAMCTKTAPEELFATLRALMDNMSND